MDIGTINRSDNTAGEVRSFLNTRRARPFISTLPQREHEIRDADAHQHAENPSFSLHMGHHEPLPVRPCRSRVAGIGLHHHKLFGSQSMVLRIDEGRAVCGSWSLAVGWKIDAESIIGPGARVHVSVDVIPVLHVSPLAVGLLSDTVMVRFRLAQGSNLWENKLPFGLPRCLMGLTHGVLALAAQAAQHANHAQYLVSVFFYLSLLSYVLQQAMAMQ
ncbi:hypothetical protein BC827DRAFT_135826 [Russula dissimulans]|nr:hypothetical protein BC827DRAFT_135826 [Russula dissimulans]